MPVIRRHTPAMFGVGTGRQPGEMPARYIDDLSNAISLVTSQFTVEDFVRVSQRAFEKDTDIVTCYIMLEGHVTKDALERVLAGIKRYNPERHYVFSNVVILPVGANPRIYQH